MNNLQKSSNHDSRCYAVFMGVNLTFGEWLDDQLRSNKWTQAAFAEKIEVAPSTVSTWIKGVQPPRRRTLRRIAEALNININEVLVRAGYGAEDPEFRLEEDEGTPLRDLPSWVNDPRVRFFAAKKDALTEAEWLAVKTIIEQLAKDDA